MCFERKKERALAIMQSKKMWPSNYAPPLIRGLWFVGLKIPPLPFAPFWQITLVLGSGFALCWGAAMWWSLWRFTGIPFSEGLYRSLGAGLLFGLVMALFQRWRNKANRLPAWKNL